VPRLRQTILAAAEFCAYCGTNQTEERAEKWTDVDAPAFGVITVPTTPASNTDALARRRRLSSNWHTWGAPTTPRCVVNQCERCTGFDPYAPQNAGFTAPR